MLKDAAVSRQLISPDHQKNELLGHQYFYAIRYEASLTFLLSTSDSGLASQLDTFVNKKDLLVSTVFMLVGTRPA